MMLVSKPLNGDNYSTWSRAMKISLSAKNKLGFVDGTVAQPFVKIKLDDHASWQRCNDMIIAWIINSIDLDIVDSILYMTDAYAISEELCERYCQSNAPRIFQLQQDIASLTQDQLSIAAYYTKMKSLWDELSSYSDSISCTCGAQNERNKLMQFLMGPNDSYSAVRGQLLLMNPLPTVCQAYASISRKRSKEALPFLELLQTHHPWLCSKVVRSLLPTNICIALIAIKTTIPLIHVINFMGIHQATVCIRLSHKRKQPSQEGTEFFLG
ncbi:uncharacterized protein [Malus domestica]|uniref:uncharacterized protein n=1 Tax=Malus domestica TaxID=3750 RepID=UPI0039748198